MKEVRWDSWKRSSYYLHRHTYFKRKKRLKHRHMAISDRIIIKSKQLSRNSTKNLRKHSSSVFEATSSKKEIVRFLHDTCFYPVKSTWITSIENVNYTTFPGLMWYLVNQHLPSKIAKTQEHQHLKKYGIIYNTARVELVTVALEPEVHETHSKVLELPHFACID